MSKFAFLKALPLVAIVSLAVPAAAQSIDEHHGNQPTQTLPAPAIDGMPGLGMSGPMGPMGGNGAPAPGMGNMMQMMQMMQSSQMTQMAQMMQMMQMMQQMQGGMPGGGTGLQRVPGGMVSGMDVAGGDVEQFIAGYGAALAVTGAQQPQWDAFAAAIRTGARQIQQARNAAASDTAAPAQLERRAAFLAAEAAAMKQSQASMAALYNVLSAKQKEIADRLMADHLARM